MLSNDVLVSCSDADDCYDASQYTFPPQPLVISACAELARRIVAGQSTSDGAGDRKLTMDSFVAVDKSPEKKRVDKTLIVVGYVHAYISPALSFANLYNSL